MDVVGNIQSKSGTYIQMERWGMGVVFRPIPHPDGVEVPSDISQAIAIDTSGPFIPKECWTAMQRLFIYCIERDPRTGSRGQADTNNEVCVLFAHKDGNPKDVIVCAVPQVVGPARVSMDRTKGAINIITGEYYKHWPPIGYTEFGDCHSHNRMGAFFSGTDDRDDMGMPGIHLVCGEYKKDKSGWWRYSTAVSIVAANHRFRRILDIESMTTREMRDKDLLDYSWVEEVTLHDDTLKHVHIEYPKDFVKEKYEAYGSGITWYTGDTRIGQHGLVLSNKTYEKPPEFGDGEYDEYYRRMSDAARQHWLAHGEIPSVEELRKQVGPVPWSRDKDRKQAPSGDVAAVEAEVTGKEAPKTPADMPGQIMLFEKVGLDVGANMADYDTKWAIRRSCDMIWDMLDELREEWDGDENAANRVFAAAINRYGVLRNKAKPLIKKPKQSTGE